MFEAREAFEWRVDTAPRLILDQEPAFGSQPESTLGCCGSTPRMLRRLEVDSIVRENLDLEPPLPPHAES